MATRNETLKRAIRKKKFVYKKRRTSYGKYGGSHFEAEIFQLVKNDIKRVGTTKWNTSSYAGDESTVFKELVELKLIPKKIIKDKAKKGRKGYYGWGDREEYGLFIEEI
tara:strand:+ start:353 stop:679 length:327 start_codon:yes stop_codon:yes gene_type:complete